MQEESQIKPYIKMSNEVSWFSPTLQLLSYSSSPNSFVVVIATNASVFLEIASTCLCASTEIGRGEKFHLQCACAKIYPFNFFISTGVFRLVDTKFADCAELNSCSQNLRSLHLYDSILCSLEFILHMCKFYWSTNLKTPV